MSAAFVVLYAGATISTARLVGASSDANLVADVCAYLLDQHTERPDHVTASLDRGRRGALRLIRREARDASRS